MVRKFCFFFCSIIFMLVKKNNTLSYFQEDYVATPIKSLEKNIFYKRLSSKSIAPSRNEIGMTIFCPIKVVLRRHSSTVIDTQIMVKLPFNYYGIVLNIPEEDKIMITTFGFASQIQRLKIRVANFSSSPLVIRRGQRLCQIICSPCYVTNVQEIH